MKRIREIINKYIYIIIFLFAIPAVRYLFVKGYFGVSDDLHVGWLFEMDRSIKALQFPPRFVPDLSFGFGYPLFNFVYPLPFYIAEMFHLVGFSLTDSIKILMGLSLPLSSIFMYKFLRLYLNEELSLSGAVLYLYSPYRALEIFVRGSIGEIVAFVFFPLVLFSLTKLYLEENKLLKNKFIALGAFSLGALVLSHNIMAYMFVPFVVVYALFLVLFVSKNKIYLIFDYLKVAVFGLLLSIYFWLPAILESSLMQYSTVFNFYDHYPTLKQLITPFWGYGASVPGPYDTMSFYSGLTGVFVFLVGFLFFVFNYKKYENKEKAVLIWSALVLVVSVFMMNHRSSFFWQTLPLLPYFQFPWRFLAMLTLVYPLFLISFSKIKNERVSLFVSILVVAFSVGNTFNYFKYSEFLGRNDEYYINRYIPLGTASEEYKKTGEEYLRLPKNTTTRPDKVYPRVYLDEGVNNVNFEVDNINSLKSKIVTKSDSDFVLNYSKYYYPGWVAKIDGTEVKINPGSPYGQITIMVPEGEHQVEIYFKETLFRKLLNIVSLLTAVLLVILSIKKYKNK